MPESVCNVHIINIMYAYTIVIFIVEISIPSLIICIAKYVTDIKISNLSLSYIHYNSFCTVFYIVSV